MGLSLYTFTSNLRRKFTFRNRHTAVVLRLKYCNVIAFSSFTLKYVSELLGFRTLSIVRILIITRKSGRWIKSETPVILCVIHHRQNPIESKICLFENITLYLFPRYFPLATSVFLCFIYLYEHRHVVIVVIFMCPWYKSGLHSTSGNIKVTGTTTKRKCS
jgi:hypothetical protein